jgi:hypothetical protein
LEAAVGHSHLLSTIENDSNTVAFGVLMHDAADVNSALLMASAT